MDIKLTIYLHSKYSENSKKFMDILKQVPENILFNMKFNSICVDNEKIRKSILNSTQMNIKVVPCILVIYNDGGVQKYEGPDAFIWLEDIIAKINADIEKEQQILYEKQLIEQEKQQIIIEKKKLEEFHAAQQRSKVSSQNIKYEGEVEDEIEDEIEIELEEESQPQPISKKKKVYEKIKKLPPKKMVPPQYKKTSIEELESETEEYTENGEEELGEIFENIESEREDTKKDALSLKKESLMSAAMAMQKSRESQDSEIKKPMMINR